MPAEQPTQRMTKRDYEAAKRAQTPAPAPERSAAPMKPSQVEGAGKARNSERFYTGLADQIMAGDEKAYRSDAELVKDAAKEIDKALAVEKGLHKADDAVLDQIIGRLSFSDRKVEEKQALQEKLKQIWKLKDSIRREMERAEHAKNSEIADGAELAAADLQKKLRKLVA